MAETFNIGLGLSADSASVKAAADTISSDLKQYLDNRLSKLDWHNTHKVFATTLEHALEASAKNLKFDGLTDGLKSTLHNVLTQAQTDDFSAMSKNLQAQIDAFSAKLGKANVGVQEALLKGAPNAFEVAQKRVISLTTSLEQMQAVMNNVDFNKVAVGSEDAVNVQGLADAFQQIETSATKAYSSIKELQSLMQTAGNVGLSASINPADVEGSVGRLTEAVEARKQELTEEAQLRAQETAEMQRQQTLSSALLSEQSRMTQLIGDAMHEYSRLQSEQEHLIKMGERGSERYQELLEEKEAWNDIIDTVKGYREEIKEMRADAKSGGLLGQEFYKNVSTTTGKVTSNIPTLQEAMEANRARQVSDSMLSRIRDALSAKGQQSDAVENESEEVKALIAELNTAKDALAQLLNVGGSPTAIVETQTQIQQLEQAITNARNGVQEVVTSGAAFPRLFGTANWGQKVATGMQSANSAMDKTEKEADEVADAIKLIKNAGTKCASVLRELGVTASEAGDKGEKGANKARTAHQNFQSTLTSVRYGLSAIGINSSSILGKMITLVGLLEDAFRGAGSAAQSIIPILGVFLSLGMSVFGTLIKWARKLLNVLVQIGQKLVELSTKAISLAKKAVTSLTDKIKGFINFFKPSLAKLKKMLMQWGLGARSPYFVIRKIRTMVIDGMKEIAQYSDSVATSMNNFKTALNQVKGSVVSAFEPVASYVIPILTRLLNVLASVLDSIAKFNATLLGRSTYFKFVAADVDEYGKSVSEAGKASKKAQRDLMGFDEINRLSAPNEGAGGGASSDSMGKYVETAIDEESALNRIAKRIREAWLAITGYDENGEPIYGSFEDSMKMLYDTFWDIGFKIGTNINAGLIKFNSNADNYKKAAMKIGQSLAAAINGFVDTPAIGYNLGKSIANLFNIAFSGLHQFATTVHWDKVGKFIGDGIASGLTNFDWYQFFDTIVQFINGLANMIYNIAVGHDWGAIGKNIAQSIFNALKNFDAAKAGKAVHEFLGAVLDFINGFVEQMSTPQKVGMKMEVDPKTGKLLSGEVISEYKTGWDLLAEKIKDFWDNLGAGELGEKAGSAASGGFFGFFKVLSGGADLGKTVKEFIDGFCKKINEYPWQSAMHDWWDIFYPKLKSFLSWAAPKILELLQWLWDTISPKVLEIAKEIGKVIGKALMDGIKSAALGWLGVGDAIDVTSGHEKEITTAEKISNLSGADILKLRQNWDSLSKDTQEALKLYSDGFRDLTAKTASSTTQMATDVDNSTKKLSGSYNSAAESAKCAGEAQNKANASVAESSGQAFNAVGNNAVNASNVVAEGFSSASQSVQGSMAAIEPAAQGAYASVTQAFDQLTPYMEETTGSAVNAFFAMLRPSGDLAQGLALATNSVVTSSVNTMVDAINTYAMTPLINLANLLDRLRTLNVGGMTPFMALPKFNFVKIPKLAQGAVLPPNQPFLSMVGDQRNGTNVEAPLDTIKQAVAEVMYEQLDGMMAGFEAVVQAINNKDTTAVISYSEIGRANNVYQNRRSTQMGY